MLDTFGSSEIGEPMPQVDEPHQAQADESWLSDELWAQIRPRRARGQFAVSASLAILAFLGIAAWWIGAFHTDFGGRGIEATATRGTVLVVVAQIENTKRLPVHVTTLRDSQPGLRLIAASAGASLDAPIPPSTKISPFTLSYLQRATVTLFYDVDCARITQPLRIEVGTDHLVGNQTSTITLDEAVLPALHQMCPGYPAT